MKITAMVLAVFLGTCRVWAVDLAQESARAPQAVQLNLPGIAQPALSWSADQFPAEAEAALSPMPGLGVSAILGTEPRSEAADDRPPEESRQLAFVFDGEVARDQEISQLKNQLANMKSLMNGMSHDLNNNLTTIALSLQLIHSAHKSAAPRNAKLENISGMAVNNAAQASRILDNYLKLKEIEEGKSAATLDATDAKNILRAAKDGHGLDAKQRGITVTLDLPKGDVPVKSDQSKLGIVIDNLIGNAIRYTPEKGKVKVGLSVSGREATIYVEDTGIGIKPEDQEKIFQGHRTKEGKAHSAKGSGVGLPLVRGLVEAQGSKITVKSVPGRGSRFEFKLPVWSK